MISETEELEVGKLASLLGVNKEEALRSYAGIMRMASSNPGEGSRGTE
jgi:hypothetical protein